MSVLEEATTGMRFLPLWLSHDCVFGAARRCFDFESDRVGGELYPDPGWPPSLTELGPQLLTDLQRTFGFPFTSVSFQAYRNGSGCRWHTDAALGTQVILSLGVTRTFGVRPNGGEPSWVSVRHGDLVFMTSTWQQDHQHCVLEEDVPDERIALVFRTLA